MSENPVLNISDTSTDYNVNSDAQIIAPDLAITDSDGGTLDGAKVTISNKSDGDFLGIAGQTGTSGTVEGLTWNYDESTGVLTLSGEADNSVYESALRQVTYSNTSDNPDTTQRDVQFSLGSKSVNPENGHIYEYVEATDTDWTTAKSEAEAKEYFGQQGYLATITSSEEQEFIEEDGQAEKNAWIGASDATTEGDWEWVTGPEAGTEFWSGDGNGTAVGNEYNNWSETEPNNLLNTDPDPTNDREGEHYAHIQGSASLGGSLSGKWNDLPDTGSTGAYEVEGYLVEYGGSDGDPELNITSNVAVNITSDEPDNPNPPDFDGDGQAEILWRDFNAGNNEIWKVKYDESNATEPFSTDVTTLRSLEDTNWRAEGIEDFNGDGIDDILWRNYETGENTIWVMKNGTDGIEFDQEFAINTAPGEQLEIENLADVTGDGTKDIIWRNYENGTNGIWEVKYDAENTEQPFSIDSTNTTFIDTVADTNWKIVESGDFNNDNISDILWYNESTGETGIWLMKNDGEDGSSLDKAYYLNDFDDVNWKVEGVADFNQDGNDDILWRNYSTGANGIWLMEDESSLGDEIIGDPGLNVGWQLLGNDDSSVETSLAGGSGVALESLDVAWDIEGVADYTGDDTPDILWRNYETGENAIWVMGSDAGSVNVDAGYSIDSKTLEWQVESPTTNNDYVAVI